MSDEEEIARQRILAEIRRLIRVVETRRPEDETEEAAYRLFYIRRELERFINKVQDAL